MSDAIITLEQILAVDGEPDQVFTALLPALCEVLESDRCFLYLRSPHTCKGKVAYCWRRQLEYPDVSTTEWAKEPESLAAIDPLFAASLRAAPSIFVDDVETASPDVVNLAFEREHFGHRALIHAHLCQDGLLWGILQPCIFNQPRVWTEADKSIINAVTKKITPLAIAYVNAAQV